MERRRGRAEAGGQEGIASKGDDAVNNDADNRSHSSFFDESGSCISRNGRRVVGLHKKGPHSGYKQSCPSRA